MKKFKYSKGNVYIYEARYVKPNMVCISTEEIERNLKIKTLIKCSELFLKLLKENEAMDIDYLGEY